VPEQTNWDQLSQLVENDRRKGKRVPLTFPVEVSGLDGAGRLFVEQTTTSEISEWGCRLKLKTRVVRGDVVAVRLLVKVKPSTEASEPVLFEIAWSEENRGEWLAGARKLQAAELWHVSFPQGPGTKSTSRCR